MARCWSCPVLACCLEQFRVICETSLGLSMATRAPVLQSPWWTSGLALTRRLARRSDPRPRLRIDSSRAALPRLTRRAHSTLYARLWADGRAGAGADADYGPVRAHKDRSRARVRTRISFFP
jgi:hypothetical protein